MKKHKGYFYTTRVAAIGERNNSTPIKYYAWFIRNKSGEVLQSSLDDGDFPSLNVWDSKAEAEYECREAISEYYR